MNKNLVFQTVSISAILTRSLVLIVLTLMIGACQTVEESEQGSDTKRLAMVSRSGDGCAESTMIATHAAVAANKDAAICQRRAGDA